MAGNDLGVLQVDAGQLGGLAGHILVAGAVGAVLADPVLLIILVGQAVHIVERRHGLVEGRVESHHLGHVRKDLLHRPDAEQVRRVVKRGEIAANLDLGKDILVDEGAAREEIRTLDDTVADRLDVVEGLEHAAIRIHEGVQQELHADLVVGDGKILRQDRLAGGLVGQDSLGETDFLDDALGHQVIYIIALHVQQLVLDGRAAAIDYKNDHK